MYTLKPHSRCTLISYVAITRRYGVYLLSLALGLTAVLGWIVTLSRSTAAATSLTPSGSGLFSSASSQIDSTISLSFNRWSSNGPEGKEILSIAIEPSNPSVLYAGTDSGLFKSNDNGFSWSRLTNLDRLLFQNDQSNDVGSDRINVVTVDPLNTSTIYVGSERDGVFKSTDGGAHWTAVNTGLIHDSFTNECTITALAIDPRSPNTIYAVLFSSAVFKSTNGAAGWELLSGFWEGLTKLVIAPGNPNSIYIFALDCSIDPGAGCFQIVAKSDDDGVNWNTVQVCPCQEGFGGLSIDPHNAATVYLGAYGGVLKTVDAGTSWHFFSEGMSSDFSVNFVKALAVDPSNPNVLYAGTSGAGIFKSLDGGLHWTSFNEDLTNLFINSLAIDSSGRNLHAGTRSGVFDYRITTNCVYSISPVSQSFPSAGSSGSVNVTTSNGCSWQASSDVSWLTITSGASSVGAGTVVFSVATDNQNSSRTGALNIAGQTFTVNQSGTQSLNPIDDTVFFVRQHYLDFLGREPDPEGLAFWVSGIENCDVDLHCREVKRIDTSAAFFLSIEFQNTGYFVERIYKVSYGDILEPLTQLTVPIIRRQEFLDDSAIVRQGVIVNVGNWKEQLDANKSAFALTFIQRQRFADAYPITMTPEAFVNQLFARAGVAATAGDHAAAINEFAGAANTADMAARARALRLVADAVEEHESNRAFVLMQYFGYLQRNPNDAPDSNYAGWNFWLSKLDQFNGDYRAAEMVKAFISSTEYRSRFGP